MIARLTDLCARHRVFVLLAAVAVFGLAVEAMRRVELDAMPDLGDPQVIVFSEWPGRSPTLVEEQVTYPLVTNLLALPHVVDVRGQSMFGMSFVYVVFDEEVSLDAARTRVNERLAQARAALPDGATLRLGPDASGIGWVYQYALVAPRGGVDLATMRWLHDTRVAPTLAGVDGVAEIATVGSAAPEYQVIFDPTALAARGLSPDELVAAVRAANGESGARLLEVGGRELYVRGRGTVRSADDLGRALVRLPRGGDPVRLSDVAQVRLGPGQRRGAADLDGEGEVISGIVVMRHGSNALEVIEGVERALATLEPALPRGVEIRTVYDRAGLVRRAIDTLRTTLFEEMGVVCLVILIFLMHPRSALLPAVSLPLVVALSFVPMALFGIPATIMSLGGIAIAIGATVDAEIVMIEACHKRLESLPADADDAVRRAALAEAAHAVTPAIVTSLLVMAVSFLPVFGLTGQAGRLFQPLAFTKTFVMLAAALVSVTLGPALRDILLAGRIVPERDHPVSRGIRAVYGPFVHAALRNPRTTILVGVFAIASAVPLVPHLGREFMPTLDEGDLLTMPTTLPGISVEEARRVLEVQDRILRSFPEVRSVLGKVGRADTPTDPAPVSMIETVVQLVPPEQYGTKYVRRWYVGRTPDALRPLLAAIWPEFVPKTRQDLVAELDRALRMPGFTNAFTQPIRNRIDMLATGIRTPVGIKVFGDDLDAIERTGLALETVVRGSPGVRSVFYERASGGAYVDVVPDREALARAGLDVATLEDAVATVVGGVEATVVIDGRRRIPALVRAEASRRDTAELLRALDVRGVTLDDVADVVVVAGPSMVRDEAGSLVGYVFVDLDERVDLGTAVSTIERRIEVARREGRVVLPPGGYLRITGQYEQMLEMQGRMARLVPLSLLLTFVLLYLQFRSALEALVVMLSVPFALVGSVWALYLSGYAVSTAVLVGVLALVGLATQTGVVMIVYIDEAYHRRQREGRIRSFEDIVAAHAEGTIERVRPKLMTVGTMFVGLVPLLFAEGAGADVMRRVAMPMIGGLATSAFLTLEIIPVVYTYFRWEETVHDALSRLAPERGRLLAALARALGTGIGCALALASAAAFLLPPAVAAPARVAALACGLVAVGAGFAYLHVRRGLPRDLFPTETTA